MVVGKNFHMPQHKPPLLGDVTKARFFFFLSKYSWHDEIVTGHMAEFASGTSGIEATRGASSACTATIDASGFGVTRGQGQQFQRHRRWSLITSRCECLAERSLSSWKKGGGGQ